MVATYDSFVDPRQVIVHIQDAAGLGHGAGNCLKIRLTSPRVHLAGFQLYLLGGYA